jgi:hypothetical protein
MSSTGHDYSTDDAKRSYLNFTPLTASILGSVKDEDASPDLGTDMAAIRDRVLGRRGAGAGEDADLTTDEHREVYDELKSRHQVDLNLEANAAALEDPSLIAHMEAARRRLAEQEKALLRLPRREALRTTYLQAMGKISTLIRKLDDEHQAERENVEIGYRQVRVLKELAEGRKPHGFPSFGPAAVADPGTKEAMGIASKKAAGIAKSYEDILALIESAKQTLFVLRRDIETFGDGFLELIEASEEDRRRLREFLQIASQRREVKAVADPSNTLGERLLSASCLPEESEIEDKAQGE